MKVAALLFACACAVLAENTPDTLFAHVDFVKPASGKSAEYHKALKDLLVPKLQKHVDEGDAYAFVNFFRRFPHGSAHEFSEIRFMFGPSLKSVAKATTAGAGMQSGLFSTISGEVWRINYSVKLEQFFHAKYYRALFVKALPGKTTTDIINVYKDSEFANLLSRGMAVFHRAFPTGAGMDYTAVVMHAYTDLDQIPGMVPGTAAPTADAALLIERLRQVRDTVRIELWERGPEFVAPKK